MSRTSDIHRIAVNDVLSALSRARAQWSNNCEWNKMFEGIPTTLRGEPDCERENLEPWGGWDAIARDNPKAWGTWGQQIW